MKHFLYTDTFVRRDRSGNTTRETCLYSVKRNKVEFLGKRQHSYESEEQAAMNLIEDLKVLPAKWLVSAPMGGRAYAAYKLEELGVASIKRFG